MKAKNTGIRFFREDLEQSARAALVGGRELTPAERAYVDGLLALTPAERETLAEAIRCMPVDTATYKGIEGRRDAVLGALDLAD